MFVFLTQKGIPSCVTACGFTPSVEVSTICTQMYTTRSKGELPSDELGSILQEKGFQI